MKFLATSNRIFYIKYKQNPNPIKHLTHFTRNQRQVGIKIKIKIKCQFNFSKK